MSNHYATLEVTEAASADEIKNAYRALAKKHHPDLGGDVTRFQQVSEAYEVLSNPDKRAHYDHTLRNPQPQHFHHDGFPQHADIMDEFSRMFGFDIRRAHQTPKNRNIRISLELQFLETLDHIQKTLEYRVTNGSETITLEIPPGIVDGTVFQIGGRGDNANTAIPRGNLEVVVKVTPHPSFTRADDNVVTSITIDCLQAILGTEVEVDTPRGQKIQLRVPPGTQHNSKFGITDQGFQRQNRSLGKFIVEVNILIPTTLNQDQLNLVQQVLDFRPITHQRY